MGSQWGATPPPRIENATPPTQPNADSDSVSDGHNCPECGKPLESQEHANKESIIHYGDKPLPNRPDTLLARQRQAVLLGREVPEV